MVYDFWLIFSLLQSIYLVDTLFKFRAINKLVYNFNLFSHSYCLRERKPNKTQFLPSLQQPIGEPRIYYLTLLTII